MEDPKAHLHGRTPPLSAFKHHVVIGGGSGVETGARAHDWSTPLLPLPFLPPFLPPSLPFDCRLLIAGGFLMQLGHLDDTVDALTLDAGGLQRA
jgi:hypothetical protein